MMSACSCCKLQADAQCELFTAREQMVVLLLARNELQDAQGLADRIGAGDDIARLRAAGECYRSHSPAEFDAEMTWLSAQCADALRAYTAAGAAVHDAHAAIRSGEGACANVRA